MQRLVVTVTLVPAAAYRRHFGDSGDKPRRHIDAPAKAGRYWRQPTTRYCKKPASCYSIGDLETTDSIGWEDWTRWADSFERLPVVRTYPGRNLQPSWKPFWTATPSLLLESGKAGRYTVLAPRIERILQGNETEGALIHVGGDGSRAPERMPGSPLEVIRAWLLKNRGPRLPGLPPCLGGLAGFFSYDLARTLERLPAIARRDIAFPLYALADVSECLIYDHTDQTLYSAVWHTVTDSERSDRDRLHAAFEHCRKTADNLAQRWVSAETLSPELPAEASIDLTRSGGHNAEFSLSREGFIDAVRRIQEYIAAGDTYQVNLSLRETRALKAAPEDVYEALRKINPSPYMGLLRFPGLTLVSGSPELLVRLRGNRLEARPIAGTRPRDREREKDRSLAEELMAHPKERAEHLMLVDLIRNDLGRVSRYGTVKVRDFMVMEDYSHVRHIVSHIEGELAEGRDALDVLAATFPGGTITGAPKVRTMEIIEELEPVRRGPYTGSIGWINPGGEMELNITIRTLAVENGRGHVQAGAGIVADSIPVREYEESLNKARALWVAVESAEAAYPAPAASEKPIR